MIFFFTNKNIHSICHPVSKKIIKRKLKNYCLTMPCQIWQLTIWHQITHILIKGKVYAGPLEIKDRNLQINNVKIIANRSNNFSSLTQLWMTFQRFKAATSFDDFYFNKLLQKVSPLKECRWRPFSNTGRKSFWATRCGEGGSHRTTTNPVNTGRRNHLKKS